MMLDVSDSFDDDTAGPLTLFRKGGGRFERGQWIEGSLEDREIVGSLQPVTGREFQNLPEGLRNEARATLFTSEAIQSDDLIEDAGTRYRILSVDDWQRRGGYSKAVLALARAP